MTSFNNRPDGEHSSPGIQALVPGMVLVGIGALFLLDNLRIVRIHDLVNYWPVLLIAFGLMHLVDATDSGRRIAGGVLAVAGGLLLADNLGFITFRWEDLWPLILIAAGLVMIWNRVGPGRNSRWSSTFTGMGMGGFASRTRSAGSTLHEAAMFGGSKRVITAQDFQGGHVQAVFGGVSVDLTGANIAGSAAVLKVSAVYGGVTVRIPTTWSAEVRGSGFFGGFADETNHPPLTPDTKHLIVKGGAVFGGVTIKN